MKYFLFLTTVLFFITSCADTETKLKPEQQIVGVWHLKDYGSGNYEYSQLGFTPDGRKCVVAITMNGFGKPMVNYYDNTWKIKDGVLETIVGNSPSSSLPKGYLIRDHIKLLNHDELIVKMESDSGNDSPLEKHQKLQGVKPERICQLVENYARSLSINNA